MTSSLTSLTEAGSRLLGDPFDFSCYMDQAGRWAKYTIFADMTITRRL